MHDDQSMPVEYMCALCGQGIDDGDLDPCALIVVGKWRAPEREQREQQFFTHAQCLLEVLHPEAQGVAGVLDISRGMYGDED